MRHFVLNRNSHARKKPHYVTLVAFFILLAILPGVPLSEEWVCAQHTLCSPSGFSFSPVLQSPFQPEVKLSKGKFLVASRQLKDPNFSETVVLLLEYDQLGAMGVVINRPTEVRLSAVLPDMEGLRDLKDTLYLGGPVGKNQMLLLIRSGSQPEDSRRVFDDLYVSSSRLLLERLLENSDPGKTFRLYAGYAGWSPGQLDREVVRGGWHVLRADVASVFEKAPAEVWPELIHRSSAQWVRLMGLRGNVATYVPGRGSEPEKLH